MADEEGTNPPPIPPVPSLPPGPYVASPLSGRPRSTNGLAVASFVLGILWLWWFGSVLAVISGFIARAQIKRAQDLQAGDGLAIAGIVLGFLGIAAFVVLLVAAATTTTTPFG